MKKTSLTNSIEIAKCMQGDWPNVTDYWNKRKNYQYYQIVYDLVYKYRKNSNSILDVGSFGCPYLEWFDDFKYRTSIDIVEPYKSRHVKSIKNDFLAWNPDRYYDVVMCLQVISMIKNANDFAQKLLSIGNIVIITSLCHWVTTVDQEILKTWFKIDPIYSVQFNEEPHNPSRLQIIQVYSKNSI